MGKQTLALILGIALCCHWVNAQKDEQCPCSNCPCSCLQRFCTECDRGQMTLDLINGKVYGEMTDVTVTSMEPNDGAETECRYMALLKATFLPPASHECRDLLKIHMDFCPDRDEWMFDFADSHSCNGHGGDGNHQYNDAEMDEYNGNVRVWSSDRCNTTKLVDMTGAVGPSTNYADVWIGNEYYKFKNNLYETELCDPCLYALNGQNDPDGPINYDVYLAFNRVASGTSSRNGYGTGRVTLTWHCRCEYIG